MLEASCHCGAVRITLPQPPEFLVECNCSICRRNGALWAFYESASIRLTGHAEHCTAYVWGQKTIRTLHCKHCGCATHWEPIAPASEWKYGVNMRNVEPSMLQGIRVRRFDGAENWTYLD